LWLPAAALLAAGFSPAAGAVRLLSPGDDMMPLSSFPQLMQGAPDAGKTPKLDTIRVAVAAGDLSLLAGMTPHAAPFELVALGEGPDLVWDPGSQQAMSKGEIIAYDITQNDLPEVIDRMALAHGLAKLAAARPQPIRLVGGSSVRRKGDRVELELDNMLNRALVLFSVGGDGAVQTLYPIGGDPRIITTPTFNWTFQVREPFGTDLIVAVTAAAPMDALDHGVEDLSHYRSAGEVLKLIALAAPGDARIGVAALLSAP
jgi:hypothetical protein